MRSYPMSQVIDRRRYDTATATLLCSDTWWDGHNHERSGTNTFLFRTPKFAYFYQHLTQWQGEHDRLQPVDLDGAYSFFESCEAHGTCEVSLDEAFPNIKIEDA